MNAFNGWKDSNTTPNTMSPTKYLWMNCFPRLTRIRSKTSVVTDFTITGRQKFTDNLHHLFRECPLKKSLNEHMTCMTTEICFFFIQVLEFNFLGEKYKEPLKPKKRTDIFKLLFFVFRNNSLLASNWTKAFRGT